ncbi:hypothetical protein AB1Y20_015292 [Prymnesium parvum]|uniref:Uncharacterized protein n=1 Tax=Prymnesium parvum TaxID=97485 RepID=A0AB34K044_PRYPA|mmetsp:Transcript_36502/g.90838  ORF Transcript_36502/g.90838 Transcript_36502/m.90838 type:complete len:164 (-) Transcript_36502:248-739(-)
MVALALLLAMTAKLPFDAATDHIDHDCWVPDYCEPKEFRYKLCKLRLRGRKPKGDEFQCGPNEFCEEVDCLEKCWLPTQCTCASEGKFAGRMMCSEDCYAHPSTQWGLCVPLPEGQEEPEHDEPLKTHFHFYTQHELLYNSKLHIDEDSPMRRVPTPTSKEEL